jgi:hypothetical protein
MKVFVAWTVDQLDGLIATALMSDNTEELRRISSDVRRGNENFKAWAMAVGGAPILDLGTTGCVEVPADRMTELPTMTQKFEAICDASLSIGVGMSISEAYTAMRYSARSGGERISLYTPEMEETEEQKPQEEDQLASLGKSGETGSEEPVGYTDPPDGGGTAPTRGDSQGNLPNPAETHAPVPENSMSPVAANPAPQGDPNGGQPSQQGAAPGDDQQGGDPRAVIINALQAVKQQAPVLEQMKQTNPQAYDAVRGIVDALIMLAQGAVLQAGEPSGGDEGEATQKSEQLGKGTVIPFPGNPAPAVDRGQAAPVTSMPVKPSSPSEQAGWMSPKSDEQIIGELHERGYDFHNDDTGSLKCSLCGVTSDEVPMISRQGAHTLSTDGDQFCARCAHEGEFAKSELQKDALPALAPAPQLHASLEGFMGGLKTLPKGSPERGKFITSHMNHAPFLSALKAHPQGAAMHAQLTGFLNSKANAGVKPGATVVTAKKELEKGAIGDPSWDGNWNVMHDAGHGTYRTSGALNNGVKVVQLQYAPRKSLVPGRAGQFSSLGFFNTKQQAEAVRLGHHDKVAAGILKEEMDMDKAAASPNPTKQHVEYPVGTVKDGKVKVQHLDLETGGGQGSGWKSVRAGQVMSEDGHAISARNPNGK